MLRDALFFCTWYSHFTHIAISHSTGQTQIFIPDAGADKSKQPDVQLDHPQTRVTTQIATYVSVERRLHRTIHRRKSSNPLGRNPSKCGIRYYNKTSSARQARCRRRSEQMRNDARRMARQSTARQLRLEQWAGEVDYMTQQIKRLTSAYHGNVLTVYRRRDPEENEAISYEDRDRDRISDTQGKRLRQQCLAVRVFYETIIANGPYWSIELYAQAAANHAGVDLDHNQTVSKWEMEYRNNDEHFLEDMTGKHDRNLVIELQDVKRPCLKWVRGNAKREGAG